MASRFDFDSHKAGWQHDLRDDWLQTASVCASGMVIASLDEFLTEENRIAEILRVVEDSIQSLRAFGANVPATFLNELPTGGNGEFVADVPTECFEIVAEHFAALLRGELKTDASTSPTLP